jgi:molecular chaperone GrpE (heat shock protein)
MTRSPRELANQKLQLRKQQEQLFKDFLTVLDNLDHACDHWRQAEATQVKSPPGSSRQPAQKRSWWHQMVQWLDHYYSTRPGFEFETVSQPVPETQGKDAMADVLASARQGVEMIRQSMLEALQQHQVVPLPALGQPFDPTQMHALSQRVDDTVPANTVVQEVVRGYLWQDRVLREAQVVVAVSAPQTVSSTQVTEQAEP